MHNKNREQLSWLREKNFQIDIEQGKTKKSRVKNF